MSLVVTFLRSLLLISYVAGLFLVGPSLAFGTITKLRITHSHSEGHHHDSDHHHDNQADEHKDKPGSEESGSPHSHEILVASSACFIVRAAPMVAFDLPSTYFPDPMEVFPPRDPNLHSIFRPPIV
jgi:hypothetical protein